MTSLTGDERGPAKDVKAVFVPHVETDGVS